VNNRTVISILINAHIPWVINDPAHEKSVFESISETYLPLLEVFDRLDADHIPFHLGLSISPALCCLLSETRMQMRCLDYMSARIEFGRKEVERTSFLHEESREQAQRLAKWYYDEAIERQIQFSERYERNILKVFHYYQKKGNLELLATAATHAFLPLYVSKRETIQAQIETAVSAFRIHFGKHPIGFYLPELGWMPEIDAFIRAYNFGYTICDSHALVLGKPSATKGSFYPVKTPAGVCVMARDFYATRAIVGEKGFSCAQEYRDNRRDAGFELPREALASFIGKSSCRQATGYKYWSNGKTPYDPEKAFEQAKAHAREFLDAQSARLREASNYMKEEPLCLCAVDADSLGRFWREGTLFLEALFREAVHSGVHCVSPGEYLYDQDGSLLETVVPSFSSSGVNGYAETWLDSSNDWMYRHIERAVERMTELAERFPNESGIKERALNQAARELLLAQDSCLSKRIYYQENAGYNAREIENGLRNFTTIYESLGSSHISTDWLTRLERAHHIFPYINYRAFRKKR
jgi:1,4-alpha-glucan branching enzyme